MVRALEEQRLNLASYVDAVAFARSRAEDALKRSTDKKLVEWQFLPTNLNWHRLRAKLITTDSEKAKEKPRRSSLTFSTPAKPEPPPSPLYHSTVTFGASAGHSKKVGAFKDGGLHHKLPGGQDDAAGLCRSLNASGGFDVATADACAKAVSDDLGEEFEEEQRTSKRPDKAARDFKKKALLAERVDVVLSQALSLAAAHVEGIIRCAADGSASHDTVLKRALAPDGRLLMGIECLLSTHGDEQGMLEDLVVAAAWLDGVSFHFVGSLEDGSSWRVRRGRHGAIDVDRVVTGPLKDVLINASAGGSLKNARITIDCAMFSQGINEWQTVANLSGDRTLQVDCNRRNYSNLAKHVDRLSNVAKALASSDEKASVDVEIDGWKTLLKEISTAVSESSNAAGKHVHVLLKTSDLARALSGGHTICCKSGKDRTGVAVTLEETRALAARFRVVDEVHVCKVLRRHGVRRRNLLRNTNQDKYAFNAVQVKSLPRCYRPPAGTFGGGVT